MNARGCAARAAILAPMLVLVLWGAMILIFFPDNPLKVLSRAQATPTATPATNRAPQVEVTQERIESTQLRVPVGGQVSDDGLPNPPGRLVLQWRLIEGPAGARIESPQSAEAQLVAMEPGSYRLRLTASDGELLGYAELLVVISPPQAHFEDVPPDHPAYEAVQRLSQEGFLSGCASDPPRFCPDTPLNRAQMAVFLLRGIYGPDYSPPPTQDAGFQDVDVQEWYAPWVAQVRREGFVSGCQSDPPLFCPLRVITRAEGAVLFLRLLRGASYDPPAARGTLADLPMEDWRARWAEAALQAGLMEPCDPQAGAFCPDEPLTRGRAAVLLARALGLIPLPGLVQ